MPASIGCALVDGEVWLFAEPDEIERADYFPLRVPAHARAGKSKGGQFRSASSAVLAAIENWMNAADSPDDPFEGRDKSGRLEFSTRALETAAGQLGIPPIPQRTDPETGRRIDRRPALKLALLEAARRQVRAQRDENVDKAFDHGGSRYSPPPGTRRNVRGRDGSSLGYMVFEREGGDRGDTWAAYRDDGVLLGHFETIPEAHDALQRKGAIPDGTRLRFDGDAFAVRRDGAWEVHVPAVVQPGDSPLLPDEPGRVVGTADTPEAAQALAQREMAKRRPRPRVARVPNAPGPQRERKPSVMKTEPGRPLTQRERAAEAVLNGRVTADTAKRLLGGQTPEQILQERNQTPRDRAYDRLTAPQKAAVDALAPNQANVYWGRRLEGDKASHVAAMKSLPAAVWPPEPEGNRIQYAARLSSASEGRAPRGTILSREGHAATVRWDETGRTETGVPLGDLKDLPAPAPLPPAGEAYLRKAADAPTGVPFGGREMPTLRRRGLVELHHVDTDANGKAVRYMVLTDAGRDYLDERDAQIAREAVTPRATPPEAAPRAVAPDLTGARGLSTDPDVRAVQIENRIRDAYARAPKNGTGGVSLADLRDELGESTNRVEIDTALRRMGRERGVSLIPNENRKEFSMSARGQAEREAAVTIGPVDYHYLEIEPHLRGLRPLPSDPAEAAPEKKAAAPRVPAETGLEAKTLVELRALLRQRGLPTSGTKAQLLARLRG